MIKEQCLVGEEWKGTVMATLETGSSLSFFSSSSQYQSGWDWGWQLEDAIENEVLKMSTGMRIPEFHWNGGWRTTFSMARWCFGIFIKRPACSNLYDVYIFVQKLYQANCWNMNKQVYFIVELMGWYLNYSELFFLVTTPLPHLFYL